jgi:hypothetical protein
VKSVIAASALAWMLGAEAGYAQPTVFAIGKLSGNVGDLATQTSDDLENGLPGNLLGGMGSGITYAGGTTFLAVPDRGPNAKMYNPCVDDTTSYINRFQTLDLALSPNGGAGLPYILTPTLTATTLLSSPSPLVYGTGASGCPAIPAGAPSLNAKNTYYFTGRSDNFDPSHLSNDSTDARFDPESIRVSNNGGQVYISDEYGPFIYRFNRLTGRRNQVITLPDKFAISVLSSQGAVEIASNTIGRVSNKGMEGLAITPDGTRLVGIMQSPLAQDGGTAGSTTRIVVIDVESGAVLHEFGYKFTNLAAAGKPVKYGTASEILAVNDHVFLVDERDGNGLGDGSSASFKRLYLVDLDEGVADVSALEGEANLAPHALTKKLFLDVKAVLTAPIASGGAGLTATTVPAKLEGITFGPDVVSGDVTKHTLYLANDNDFTTDAANPNQFFVFGFTDADLLGAELVPQQFVGNKSK